MLKRQLTGCSPQESMYPSKKHKDMDDYQLPDGLKFSCFRPGRSHFQHYGSLESSVAYFDNELQSRQHHGDHTHPRPPSSLFPPRPPPSLLPPPVPPPSLPFSFLSPSTLPPPLPPPLRPPLLSRLVHDPLIHEVQSRQHHGSCSSHRRVRYHQPPLLSQRIHDPWNHREHCHFSQSG